MNLLLAVLSCLIHFSISESPLEPKTLRPIYTRITATTVCNEAPPPDEIVAFVRQPYLCGNEINDFAILDDGKLDLVFEGRGIASVQVTIPAFCECPNGKKFKPRVKIFEVDSNYFHETRSAAEKYPFKIENRSKRLDLCKRRD